MKTQEMHIQIDLELQKINSQINKNLLPQEKDWFLNNEVTKFLNQRLDPQSNTKGTGFENTSKRVEDIKDLIRIKNLVIETNNRGEKFVTLPSDYFRYIRFDSFLAKECPDVTIPKTSSTMYSCKFNLNLPDTTLTTYKIELQTSEGSTTVFDINTLPSNYITTDEFKKQKFLLINALTIQLEKKLKEVLSPSLELYWERKQYGFEAYTYTLVSNTAFNSITITSNNNTTIVNSTIDVINYIDLKYTPLRAKTRVVNDEFFSDISNSHLSKSLIQSPIGVLRENVLEVVQPKGAIYGSIDIVYICKPTKIDLLLDSNVNVSTTVAKEITGNTIRFLKALLNDNNYQAYVQENMLIE